MMPSSKKGRGVKKVHRRPVPIPFSLAQKLEQASGARSIDDALLVKSSREPWKKSDHTRLFERLVRSAELDSATLGSCAREEVTIYALRHSNIARQILRGVPIRVVAVNHDTSVAMIEKNYSPFLADHADAIARSGLLDLSE